jgi:hypothetical protein
MEHGSVADALSSLANLIIAGAAVGAAIAAFMGLETWKKQSLWQDDSALARQILTSIYQHRDALNNVRRPVVLPHEMEPGSEEMNQPDSREKEMYNGLGRAYQRRWQKVYDVRARVDSLLQEADAVWGEELSKSFGLVSALETELFKALQLYIELRNPENDAESKAAVQKIYSTKRDIIFDAENDEDVFRGEYLAALTPVENFLRAKLGRR